MPEYDARPRRRNRQPLDRSGPSWGARTFVNVFRCYAIAQGPRAGLSKLADADRLRILNGHLERVGRRPVSRATYYRWKGEARALGWLESESTALRARDRRRAEGGRWLRITAPERPPRLARGRRRGRRLLSIVEVGELDASRSVSPPMPPPANATFVAPIEISPPRERAESGRSCSRRRDRFSGARGAPDERIEITEYAERTERTLAELGAEAAAELGEPWQPRDDRAPWRRSALRKAWARARRAGRSDADELDALELAVIGMAVQRASNVRRARARGIWDPFWEIASGDVVARAACHEHRAALVALGMRYLVERERRRTVRPLGDDAAAVLRELRHGTGSHL